MLNNHMYSIIESTVLHLLHILASTSSRPAIPNGATKERIANLAQLTCLASIDLDANLPVLSPFSRVSH